MSKVEKGLFYLFILAFPLNLGKHFIFPSSYVNGILVDYLIPTFYLSDIFLLGLLFCWFLEAVGKSWLRPFNLFLKNARRASGRAGNKVVKSPAGSQSGTKKRGFLTAAFLSSEPFPLLVFFLISLIPSVLGAGDKISALYKFGRLLEISGLVLFVSRRVDGKILRSLALLISCGIFFESLLAIAQWLKQGFIFGFFPFGESLIAARHPSALTDFFGNLKLRAYGTFPHPNVLGGYLAILLPLIPFIFWKLNSGIAAASGGKGERIRRFFYSLTFLLGLAALVLSFSRSAWTALVLILGFCFLGAVKRGDFVSVFSVRSEKMRAAFSLAAVAAFLVLSFWPSIGGLSPSLSVVRRRELNAAAFSMFKENPLKGVGLNNFTERLEGYRFISGPARFIQPVHGIFLLLLSESGLLGFLGFSLLIFNLLRRLLFLDSNFNLALSGLVLGILFLGLFDHYFLTIDQGLIVFGLIVGLGFNNHLRPG